MMRAFKKLIERVRIRRLARERRSRAVDRFVSDVRRLEKSALERKGSFVRKDNDNR